MTITRRESEERQQAVLKFFIDGGLSPDGTKTRLTGEEAQKALTSGKLAGKDQPRLGNHMLFRLQRQAVDTLRKGAQRPATQNGHNNKPVVLPPEVPTRPELSNDQVKAILQLAKELKERLASAGGGVTQIHITPQGVKFRRITETEESL